MSALGLAIMIVAGAVTLDVVLENTTNTDASVVGQTLSNVDLGGFFTAGVLVGLAFMLGLMLLLAGLRRANRKRQERKELERSFAGTATHAETLQEERDRLAAELEEERRARHHAEQAGPATPASAATSDEREPHRGDRGERTHEIGGPAERPVTATNGAPIYPSEPASGSAAASPGPAGTVPTGSAPTGTAPTGTAPTAGTATQERAPERTKPTLKQRLFG